MATRATYEIDGQVFYCHYDGYPAGAMGRFSEALRKRYSRRSGGTRSNPGGMPYAFIRGAMDAQPAAAHDCHGDTEFRYVCYTTPDAVTLRIDLRCTARDKWFAIYNGGLAAAVNLFTPDALAHERVWNDPKQTNRLLTAKHLEAEAEWLRGMEWATAEQIEAYETAAANARSGLGTASAYDEIRHSLQLHHLHHPSALEMASHPAAVAAE